VGVLPLLGRVAAGQPILAEENIEDLIPVSSSIASRKAFCLRVQGDSMIEDGILDGDIIIVDQEKRPRTGDIVVALIEEEATVKHYHPRGRVIELRPANATMQPMVYPAQDVSLQGVVVGLQRVLN
jgi:repressor LexA